MGKLGTLVQFSLSKLYIGGKLTLIHKLTDTLGWNDYLVTVLNMLLNFGTEYLYDRLVVYRGAVDTARRPEKQPAEDCQ